MLYPQGVSQWEVVGMVKGGRHKWVRFAPWGLAYKLQAHLCFTHEAKANALWQTFAGGGGGR